MVMLLVCMLVTSLCQAQTAQLKTASIVEGDIAVMVVEYQIKVPSLFPLDTTPLLQNFEVLQVKPSLRRKLFEDEVINIMHWELELYPVKTGTIKIPSLKIKGRPTPELLLEVREKDGSNVDNNQIYITATTDHNTLYVGQQAIITLKLFHNRNFRHGILYDLKLDQAEIYPLGADKRYQQVIEGETFTVLERKLALFANQPGVLVLPAVEFRGELEGANGRRIKRLGPRLVITLRAAANQRRGELWLPANQLEVSQEWFQVDKSLTTGDSISRNIVLRIKGLSASAIPETAFQPESQLFEIYADQAQRIDQFTKSGIVGQFEQAQAIVLTGSGNIHIPGIQIRWWDVNENVENTARLPGKNIPVAAAIQNPVETTQAPINRNDIPTKILWILAIIISLLVIIIVFCRFRLLNIKSEPFSHRKFKQACFSGDAPTARSLLISWANTRWPQQSFSGLLQLTSTTKSQIFKQQIRALDAAIFGSEHTQWQGQQLWSSYIENCTQANGQATIKPRKLPDLYPV